MNKRKDIFLLIYTGLHIDCSIHAPGYDDVYGVGGWTHGDIRTTYWQPHIDWLLAMHPGINISTSYICAHISAS